MRLATLILAAAALICFAAAPAQADLIMFLSGGGAPTTIVLDNELSGAVSDDGFVSTVADANPAAGVLVFNGAQGSFNINVTTAISKPIIGPGRIDLASVNVTNGSGSLFIYMIDTDFLDFSMASGILTQIGGTTDGTINQITAGINTSNAEGSFLNVNTMGPYGPGAFSDSRTGSYAIPQGSPFALGQAISITHNGAGDVTSFDLESRLVPEPASLCLMALGAVGVVALRRRRRKA